jgi:hypothetical protein
MQRLWRTLSEYKDRVFFLKTAGICAFWYLSMFPGRLGYDYALAIRMIQNGESTNWWTGIYFWFLRLTTFYGQSIYVASLIGLVSIVYALWYFLSSLVANRKILERSFLITLCFPIVGVFGITISHDVFQSAGLLIFLGLIWRFYQNHENFWDYISHYLLASLFLITTQTGIYTVGVITLLSLFTVYRKQVLTAFLSILVISALGNVGVSGSIIKHPTMNLFLADLRCVTQHPEAEIPDSAWFEFEKIAPKTKWLTPLSCSNADAQIAALGVAEKELSFSRNFLSAYISTVSQNPAITIQAHLQRSLGALPPPFFQGPENQVDRNIQNPVGLGTNTALQLGPELLHPSIDEPSVSQKVSIFAPLEVVAQGLTFFVNQASWFWGWGGLWLYPIFIYYLYFLKIRQTRVLLITLFPTLLLHGSYVLLGPGPLGRYYLSTIIAGLSLLIVMITASLTPNKGDRE